MSVKGFKFNNTVHKYEYGSLENIPENFAPEYVNNTAYAVGDYCTHNNILYRCTTQIAGEAWNASHWTSVDIAVELQNEVGNLKSALQNNTNNLSNLGLFKKFVNGSWSGGVLYPSYRYRVSSESIIEFDHPVKLEVADGYRIYFQMYDSSSVFVKSVGFLTQPYIVPTHQKFNISIAKVTEDTTTAADINEFVSKVTFATCIQDEVDNMDIYGVTGAEKLPITQVGYYLNTSGSTVNLDSPVLNGTYNYIVADCAPGEKFSIHAAGGSSPRAWAFINNLNEVISVSPSTQTIEDIITAPSGSTKIIINDSGNYTSYRGVIAKYHIEKLDETKEKVDTLKTAFDFETEYKPISVTYQGKYIDTSGSTADITRLINHSNYNCSVVPCSYGDIFTISALGGSAPKAWAFIDSSGNILRKTYTADVNNRIEMAPENSAYLIINDSDKRTSMYGRTDNQILIDDVTGTDYMQNAVVRITSELKDKSTLGNIVVFGFNTDQHIRDEDNGDVTKPALRGLMALSKLTQEYPYDFVCLGGDACEAGSYAITPELILDECVTVQKPLHDAWCPVIPIAGNHDAHTNTPDVTGSMLFNAHFKRIANSGFLKGWDTTHTNGYWDSEAHQIRVIFIDSTARDEYSNNDIISTLESMLDSTPNGYKILIISHQALNSTLGNQWDTNIAGQTVLENYADKIICCLCGHVHRDISTTSGGILYIATTTAQIGNDADGNVHTINTETETAFDTFVIDQTEKTIYTLRYGLGNNRKFDYDSESLTFGEIVS